MRRRWRFKECKDEEGNVIGTTSKVTFMLDKSKTLTGYYEEVVDTGIVIFEGSVSAQAEGNEVVVITVTRPDTTTEEILAVTNEGLTFSVEYQNMPGDYSAHARVEADAVYEAAESSEVPFNIGKEPRTITLTVTPK